VFLIVIFVVSCNCSAWVLCGGCSFFPYAARQGEGCGKVSLPCGGIFFMPRHSGAPFWRVRGLLFCHALCFHFGLSGVLIFGGSGCIDYAEAGGSARFSFWQLTAKVPSMASRVAVITIFFIVLSF
jgi:hypothetical protein